METIRHFIIINDNIHIKTGHHTILKIPSALFASLEGKGDEGFRKKEGASGRNRGNWERRALDGLFFFIIQNHPHWGTQKLYWRVLDGLYELFKLNLCCYNILKIKNILIISIKY